MNESVRTRLFVPDALVEGLVIGLSPAHAHLLRSVLRVKPGEAVSLFNGRDGEWRATVDGLGKGWASLQITAKTRDQTASPDLWLAFAPIKRARLDFVVEKATELGVSALIPVITRRTNVERVREDRLHANAVEAAEQCERLDIPETRGPENLEKLLSGWPEDRPLLVCAERGEAEPLAKAVLSLPSGAGVGILTGPEGGFDPDELDRLAALPFTRFVGLGPRILRAETAAIAAISVYLAVSGDWNGRPDH